jgi:predicted MFS family arabinose efflux permease
MTSICKEYWQLFLAQGLLLGIGIAFIVLPGFTTPAQHFAKSRGMALGIVVSGSSLGGVVWPIALHNLFTEVGFGWAVRIVAFIQLPLLVIGCVFTRPPVGLIGHAKGKADFSCMKNPILILLSSGLFLLYLGLFTPFFFITSWTESLGLDSDFAFYTISIINGTSLFGRILPGILADRVGPYNIAILAAAISGLICTCLTKATTVAGITVLSLAYGFSSGVSPTQLMSLTIEDLGTKHKLGDHKFARCLRFKIGTPKSIWCRYGIGHDVSLGRVSSSVLSPPIPGPTSNIEHDSMTVHISFGRPIPTSSAWESNLQAEI